MKIATWNVNGIRAVCKKGELQKFLKEVDPDILCLQETKAQKEQNEVDFPGYLEYWNSAERKGYSGTAIFTKTQPEKILLGLPEDIIKKYKIVDDGYGDPSKEGRVITLEYKDFFVVSVYTPNAKDDLSRLNLRHKVWDPAFLAYMDILKKQKAVVFCGDLNVAHTEDDLARPKENVGVKGFTDEEREGIDEIINKNFVDSWRLFNKGNGKYTWWSNFGGARARNVGWRIDYIFVSEDIKKKVKKVDILDGQMGSDHCPVVADISL